jgi:thioredoxin 1
MATELSAESFQGFVKENEKCVIDFWAPWCGPCRMLAPNIEAACAETGVALGKVNIDDNPGLAQEYGVMSIPTVIKIVKGEEANRKVGNVSKESLVDFLG